MSDTLLRRQYDELAADNGRLLNERGRWMDCAADLTIRLEESEQERATLSAKLAESHGLVLDMVRRLHSTGDPGDQLVADLAQRAETAEQERDGIAERVAALTAALTRLAMRQFIADGTYCWCDGPVIDAATHRHDSECRQARAALSSAQAPAAEGALD